MVCLKLNILFRKFQNCVSLPVRCCSTEIGSIISHNVNNHIKDGLTEGTKLLKVAIIGTPNAGKSTLINKIVERRVFAVSKKVHTTRCRARAVCVEGNKQLIFLDTPGLVSALESRKFNLDKKYVSGGEDAIEEADIIGVVHDVSNIYTRSKLDAKILRLLHLFPEKESLLILNKIDAIKSKRKLLDISKTLTGGCLRNYGEPPKVEKLSEISVNERIQNVTHWNYFSDIFMVSALLGQGIVDIKSYLLQAARPGDWLFDEDVFTDQEPNQIIESAVRAKLLEYLPNEVPYIIGVQLEYLDHDDGGWIRAVVLIETPVARIEKLIVGNRGQKIRHIAREAEKELVDTFKSQVHLRLVVTNREQGVIKKPGMVQT